MQNKTVSFGGMVAIIGALVIALLLPRTAVALDDSQIIPGAKRIKNVSAGALKTACDNQGGTYVETGDEYLCSTDSSWVYCEKASGDCVGETDNKDGKQKNTRIANRQKTQIRTKVRGEKSGKRDRRQRSMDTTPFRR